MEDEATGLIYTVSGDKATVVGYNPEKLSPMLIVEKLGDKTVVAIGDGAFKDCTTLRRVALSDEVKTIGASAFEGCTSLRMMEFPKGINIGEKAFCNSAIVLVTFNENVGTIGPYAFAKCSGMRIVQLPNMEALSKGLFSECTGLSIVRLPENLREIGEGAFFHCTSLQSIELPDKLTTIENYAFSSCTGLLSIDIPDSVTAIGDEAFYECVGMTEVRLSHSLKTINLGAFCGCGALQSIEIPDGVTSIGWYAFEDCAALQSITLPESLTTIDADVFSCCTSLKEITIPDSVKSVGEYAFYGCSALESVTLPAGLGIIEEGLFQKCSSLTDITIPDSVTVIEGEAFRECSALTGISLPNSIRTIGKYVFGDCTGLKSIAIPNSVTMIGEGAFRGCTALTDVRLPDGLGKIGTNVFEECRALERIVIPDGVTAIEDTAFYNDISLTAITIPASVTSIGKNTFSGCPDITVYYAGTEEQANALKANTGVLNDALLAKEWVLVTETGDVPTIVFDQDYLIMRDDEDRLTILTATVPGGIPESAEVSWSVDNESVIPTLYPSLVDTENGVVQALIIPGGETGTAWVTVTLRTTAGSCSARCRIDKTLGAVLPTLEDVTLTESKAAVEVFRTDYTRITVVPNLKQNDFGTASSLIDGIPAPEPEFEEVFAIRKAEFDDPKGTGVNDYFRLHVVDDRTLEIIPTRKALEDAEAKNPALKGTYKNAVKVWVDGEGDENAFTTGPLTLTVKKTLPKLKAAPVKLNSFIKDEQEISFTGGKVTKITAIEGPTPEWLILPAPNAYPVDLTVKYDGPIHSDAPKSQKASLKLTVEAEGWAIRQTIPVTMTAAPVQPKVTFSTKTVTMNPTERYSLVLFTVTPAEYVTNGCIDFDSSFITENGNPVNEDVLWFYGEPETDFHGNPVTDADGNTVFELVFGPGSDFGSMAKSRTFKFNLDIGGKKFPLTIKTLPESQTEMSISVKTKGVIDTAIPSSLVTFDITVKGNSFVDPNEYSSSAGFAVFVTVERTKDGGEPENVTRFGGYPYTETLDSRHARFTLTRGRIDSHWMPLDPSYTYTAKLELSHSATPAYATAEVKIPIKSSDPAKVPLTVTAKAKGKIDVLRPDSEILLTPTIKNGYGFDLGDSDQVRLEFLRKVDKTTYEAAPGGLFTAEVNEAGTAFRIRMNPGFGVDVKKDKFAVRIAVRDPADSSRMARMKTPVNLPLTMGKAKITQSTKTLTLLKRDKNSTAEFTLGTTDPALTITSVRITNDKLGLYKLTELGSGQYAVSYSGRMLAAPKKGTTLKLAVTLAGNESGKPNATISLAVKFA